MSKRKNWTTVKYGRFSQSSKKRLGPLERTRLERIRRRDENPTSDEVVRYVLKTKLAKRHGTRTTMYVFSWDIDAAVKSFFPKDFLVYCKIHSVGNTASKRKQVELLFENPPPQTLHGKTLQECLKQVAEQLERLISSRREIRSRISEVAIARTKKIAARSAIIRRSYHMTLAELQEWARKLPDGWEKELVRERISKQIQFRARDE